MRGVDKVVRDWGSHVLRLIEVVHVQNVVVIRQEVLQEALGRQTIC